MSMPRCVLVTDNYLPHIGGSRIYYHQVATLLAGEMAVATRKAPAAVHFDAAARYPITRTDLRGGRWPGPAMVGEAVDCVTLMSAALEAAESPKCYLAGEITPSAFAASIAARRRRVPYGVFLHDEPFAGAGGLELRARRRILSGAGAIIAASSFAASRARTCLGPDAPIFDAPPGVETGRFRSGQADSGVLARHGVEEIRYLLSVGRLADYKNVGGAIAALALLKRENIRLVIVGEGPERPALEARCRELGVEARVAFAGRVPVSDLVQLYRGALAYVFASRRVRGCRHEGIGMAALEAAACGCAVLASSETSAADFVTPGETGFLFDPEEPSELVALLERLLAEPALRARIASAAAERVRRDFTWERTARAVRAAVAHLESLTS